MDGRDARPSESAARIEEYVDRLAVEAGLPLITKEWIPDIRGINPPLYSTEAYLFRLCVEQRCADVQLSQEELSESGEENAKAKIRKALSHLH